MASVSLGVASAKEIRTGKTLKFQKQTDRERASDYSLYVLEDLRTESNLIELVITSAIRTEEEQAEAMYDNELQRQFHSDRAKKERAFAEEESAAVSVVNSIGRINSQKSDLISSDEIEALPHHRRLKRERDLELSNDIPYSHAVGKDAKRMAREDVQKPQSEQDRDETVKEMAALMKKKGLVHVTKHAGVKGIEIFDISFNAMNDEQRGKFKAAVKRRLGSIIYRFGYPKAPSSQYTFNDKVFHIEILQPSLNDGHVGTLIPRTV